MSSTQEKRCRTCVHWGLDMICQNEDSGEQGYTCMPGAACGHWEGTGEPEVRHGRWIPVVDEYPEPCRSVLIAFSDSSGVRLQCVGIRSATHPNVWLDMHGGRIKNVTHWMYLPELPKEADSVMMGDSR